MRSFDLERACDPFITDGQQSPDSIQAGLRNACSKRFENWSDSRERLYANLCPACRLFGATVHKGLFVVQDAVLDLNSLSLSDHLHWLEGQPPDGVLRTRIGIDRWTGGVRHTIAEKGRGLTGATQSILVLPPGSSFNTILRLHNFALWQLGLVALALREINEGWARIGAGSRKGMGQAKVMITGMEFRYPSRLYYNTLKDLPSDQDGVLCAPQTLVSIAAEPEINDEQPWFGPGLPGIEGQHWYDHGWITFKVPIEQVATSTQAQRSPHGQETGTEPSSEALIQAILQHAVEESLAPRLRAGRQGFYREDV